MQPSGYAPPAQKAVRARIFTTAGWIDGDFLLPALRIFTDFVNHERDFFKLKDVQLPGLGNRIPFFALQRESVVLILPREGDDLVIPDGREKRKTDVSCAFNGGAVSGTLLLAQGIRLSDFLLQKSHFFHLSAASSFIRTGAQTEVLRDIPVVLVNSRRVVGVSEPRFV